MWYEVRQQNNNEEKASTTQICVPAGSKWFDGHFPQDPVLPGIAQVAVVHDLIRRALGKNLPIREIGRLRFKRKVGPTDRLSVTITPGDASEKLYRFRMTCGKEPVCSGLLKVGSEKEKD